MKTRIDFDLIGKVSEVNSRIEKRINQETWLYGKSLRFDRDGRLTSEFSNNSGRKEYEYDDRGNLLKCNKIKSVGREEHKYTYTYNIEDELIEVLVFHRHNSYGEFELQTRVEVINTLGKKSEERIFWFSRPLPEQVRKYFYKEDVLYRFEKTNFKENSNETNYTEVELYDSDGRIVEHLIGTSTKKTFKFDKRGCLICELGFDNCKIR